MGWFLFLLTDKKINFLNQLSVTVPIIQINNLHGDKKGFATNRFKIVLVPNITNISYGRGVGYTIEEVVLPEKIQNISATKIRKEMRDKGKIK